MTAKLRKCRTRLKKFPLDPEYWRRDKSKPGGFMIHCKKCTKRSVSVHYRKWYARDVLERGSVGVKCLLWAPACEDCEDVETCWRLEEDPDEEDIPVQLPQ